MDSVHEFLESPKGKVTAAAFVALAALITFLALRSVFGLSRAEAASRDRLFICSETGKTFTYSVEVGTTIPVHSPHSGHDSGYPAELCYWTKDGQPKREPTAVLLNSFKGDPSPTFCPDCGRLVVGHNPPGEPGMKPPPTREQYNARKSAQDPKEALHDDHSQEEP